MQNTGSSVQGLTKAKPPKEKKVHEPVVCVSTDITPLGWTGLDVQSKPYMYFFSVEEIEMS